MEQQFQLSESYETNKDKYERGNHHVGISMWEFEWCPKYCYKMFRKLKHKNLLEACIRRSASRNNIKIIEIEVDGGIRPYTVEKIVDAGADTIVAGSILFNKKYKLASKWLHKLE